MFVKYSKWKMIFFGLCHSHSVLLCYSFLFVYLYYINAIIVVFFAVM